MAAEVRQPLHEDDLPRTSEELATETGAELLVIGIRHRSPVGKLILGSDAQRILLDASVPCSPPLSAGEGRSGASPPSCLDVPQQVRWLPGLRVGVTRWRSRTRLCSTSWACTSPTHPGRSCSCTRTVRPAGPRGRTPTRPTSRAPPRCRVPCRGSTSSTSPGCAAAPSRPSGSRPRAVGRVSAGCSTSPALSTRCTRPSRSPVSTRRAASLAGPSRTCSRRPRPRGGPGSAPTCSSSGRTPWPRGRRLGRGRHLPRPDGAASAPDGRRLWLTAIGSRWVFEPRHEVETIGARRGFPDHRLRIDPNGSSTVDTSVQVAKELDGGLRVPRGPDLGIDGMAEVARQTGIPLATNMCVIAFEHLAPAVRATRCRWSSDHHLWGGLRRSASLGGICDTFGMGLSMHLNSHLGISLAAMTHLASATETLTHACDTHYPWKTEEVIKPGVLEFRDGSVRVPDGPGSGSSSTRTPSARCTSSTSGAASAVARTRHTCAPWSRASRPTPRAGSQPFWSRCREFDRCSRIAARVASASPSAMDR